MAKKKHTADAPVILQDGYSELMGYAVMDAVAKLYGLQKKEEEIKPGAVKKTVDQLAKEVIAGKWSNGAERKKKLTDAGYDYSAVQKRVNALLKG